MIRFFGITYRFHPLFVVLMGVSVLTGYFIELLTLFGIVVIHELGHVTAAKYYGWDVREVQLLPFGGVALIEENGIVTAMEEIIVSLAGPLQNGIMIAAALAVKTTTLWNEGWIDYFVQANVILALFNLIPIMPLDGGRILQALLSYRLSYYRTLIICTWISLGMSGVLLAASIFRWSDKGIDLNLLLIALFLIFSNWHAYRDLNYRFMRFLIQRGVRADMIIQRGGFAQPIVVAGQYNIVGITKMFFREKYHLIYVLDQNGAIRAVLPEHRLIRNVFAEHRPTSAVSELFM